MSAGRSMRDALLDLVDAVTRAIDAWSCRTDEQTLTLAGERAERDARVEAWRRYASPASPLRGDN